MSRCVIYDPMKFLKAQTMPNIHKDVSNRSSDIFCVSEEKTFKNFPRRSKKPVSVKTWRYCLWGDGITSVPMQGKTCDIELSSPLQNVCYLSSAAQTRNKRRNHIAMTSFLLFRWIWTRRRNYYRCLWKWRKHTPIYAIPTLAVLLIKINFKYSVCKAPVITKAFDSLTGFIFFEI